MAVTLTRLYEDVWGKTRIVGVQIKLDTSYPTGGYGATLGLSAQRIGFNVAGQIFGAVYLGANAAGSGIVTPVWDYTNKKLMMFQTGTITPAGTITLTVNGGAAGTAIGIDADANQFNLTKAAATARTSTLPASFAGTATGGTNGAEVANTTNLSAVTVRMEFRGF